MAMSANEQEVLEGGGASKFVQLIQKFGYNKGIEIELATVTASAPNIKIKLDNMAEELLAEDIIIAEQLTKHKRKVQLNIPKLTLTGFTTPTGGNVTGQGSAVTPVNTETVFAEIEFTDELKKDDRVLVVATEDGQTYIVLDRVVSS